MFIADYPDVLTVSFYKGTHRIFNRAVSWYDKGPYSHCEITFANGLSGSSSFLDGGVRLKMIDFKADHWDRFYITGDAAYAYNWYLEHDSWGYDIRGDLGFLWRPIGESKKMSFCSEAFMDSLRYPDGWRFTPNLAFAAIQPLIISKLP